jgi:hypothetical protein
MLLSWMYTGQDPNAHRECLDQFIDGHRALECVREALSGKWPETETVPPVSGQAESHDLFSEAASESPLSRLGYSTGKTGKNKSERRDILEKAFYCPLGGFPGTYPLDKLEKWGAAGEGMRLKKMAQLIADQCRVRMCPRILGPVGRLISAKTQQ